MKPNKFTNANFTEQKTPVEKNREIAGHIIDYVKNKKGSWERTGDVFTVTAGTKRAAILVNPTNDEKAEKEAIRQNQIGAKFYNAVSIDNLTKWLTINL